MKSTAIWSFLGLLFLVGIFFQIYLLSAFVVMLGLVGGLARWWQRHALDQVSYRRKFYYRRGFPGELISTQVEVENDKFLPVSWLRIRDAWPVSVGPEEEEALQPTHDPKTGSLVNLFSLRWFERSRRSYQILLRERGVYSLGPVRFQSGDLFGWFQDQRQVENRDTLTVFPSLLPFSELHLPADDPFGERRARRRLYEDPNQPMGVRDYHPEDDFRRVHWPATAHTGQLQVKVYQPVSAQVLVVCLNVSTFHHYWEGMDTRLLEHLIRVTATLVQKGIEDGFRVGLLSNGCLAHSDQPFRIPPGRSPHQLGHLLETLSAVTPLVTSSFERLLMKEGPRLPFGARLVIVTGINSPELGATLMRLHQSGREITLLSFAKEPPEKLPGIRTIHVPFLEQDA